MRRKISLYIGEQLVDLDDQSFILFNYTMDDLSNPTIVKNSFSQQITLKGTPANNKIFGEAFRADRRVAGLGGNTGVDFNASQKTPFTIYNEMNEILESGYVKLDTITRKGADIQYKVTLYGGLGSFFYALSYDDNGNKRTLASLDYLGTSNPDTELDFTITANAVKDAWDRLYGDTSKAEMWDVINFAPAYNGIPDGDFSADKALVVPSDVGLQDTIGNYTIKNGYAMVNLAEPQDEWAVKDLRSYMQRPVLSMKAFWDAICNPANNGGFEVDANVVSPAEIGEYALSWLTLPMLPSIANAKQEVGDLSLTMSTAATTGNAIGRYDIVGNVPYGSEVTANVSCRIRWNTPSWADAYNEMYMSVAHRSPNRIITTKFSVLFVQAVAYGSDDSILGGSKIKVITGNSKTAEACGYVPVWQEEYESVSAGTFKKKATGVFELDKELGLSVVAPDAAYYKILVSAYTGESYYNEKDRSGRTTYTGDGTTSKAMMFADWDNYGTPNSTFIIQGESGNSISAASFAKSLRSGAVISKATLLSSSHTPAEYMLSFCKMLGLYFTYDPATRKVTIVKRNDLYQDETIDLTRRVDTSKDITIQPMVFTAKWYDFALEGVGGAFYDEYLSINGVQYGIQRVNTGYDFDADVVNLMEGNVFKNAVTILARSKYFNYIFNGGDFIPSPFLDKGNTYTLWSSDGETLDTDISCPPATASVTYYNDNPDYKGYDIDEARKVEFRDAENKPVDGTDVLVFLEGWNQYDYFKLSDDVPAMDTLNEGVPCWLLAPGDDGEDAITIPIFQRYQYRRFTIVDSLDFGVPKQLDIPGVIYDPTCTIYQKGWRAYMEDRYDVNTKVMTCRVDFGGLQVNQELLRKFYWYDNSLWVLNKITNYSLTTYDPVECEFVQVQDKDNYLTGQTY